MPSLFPGMDPYLENTHLWPQVHHLLISLLLESLVPQLRPKYRAAIEQRVYQINGNNSVLVGIPDVSAYRPRTQTNYTNSNVAVADPPVRPLTVTVPMPEEVREGYLKIISMETGEVVTVIEVLSPANKRPGKGRQMYEQKRDRVLGSGTHLVEIDLLRGWEAMPVFGNNLQGSYRVLVSRKETRPTAQLYLFNLPDAIPSFILPLRSPDAEPVVDLQTLLGIAYDRAGYDYTLDYSGEPVPALSAADTVWVDGLLRERGLRSE